MEDKSIVIPVKEFKDLPQNIIPYRKEMRYIVQSVTACILWQQLEYWFERMKKKGSSFYKFLSPLAEEKFGYEEGDSWAEELGFSESEFRTAFSRLGISYNSKKKFKEEEDPFKGKMYCSYFDKISRKTHYFRNNSIIDVNLQRLQKIVYDGLKVSSAKTEIDDSGEINTIGSDRLEEDAPTKDDNNIPINTENTSKNTAETTSENTQEINTPLPEASSERNFEKNPEKNPEEESKKKSEEEIYFDSNNSRHPKLTDLEDLLVLRFYRKYIYYDCHAGTPSVVIGIKRILRIFRDRYQSHPGGLFFLLLLLKNMSKLNEFQKMVVKNNLVATPKLFFEEEFVYKKLLGFVAGVETWDAETLKACLSYHEVNDELKAMCIEQGKEIEYLFIKHNGKPY
jgi:hypothetical protein